MDYRRHYDALIGRARTRELTGYVERHHVTPRCMGGGDEPDNIVILTPEEHYVAHQLLYKANPDNDRLFFAAWAMSRGRAGNKKYGWLRRGFSERIGNYWRGRTRREFSEEHRRAIAAAQTGRKRGPHSEEHKAKMREAHTGKKLTEEHKAKLSAAKAGKKREAYALKECLHCGHIGGGGSMNRWHFDNCKVKHGQN